MQHLRCVRGHLDVQAERLGDRLDREVTSRADSTHREQAVKSGSTGRADPHMAHPGVVGPDGWRSAASSNGPTANWHDLDAYRRGSGDCCAA